MQLLTANTVPIANRTEKNDRNAVFGAFQKNMFKDDLYCFVYVASYPWVKVRKRIERIYKPKIIQFANNPLKHSHWACSYIVVLKNGWVGP